MSKFAWMMAAASLALPVSAQAGNIASCEVVIMDYIEDESGGGLEVASFRPAGDFLLGVYDEDTELSLTIEDRPIRALMCERNDLVPDEDDYKILATGIPFALSQDFDTNESDSLTLYFQDGAFRYKYASAYPMSEEMQTTLEARLADFSSRDHGLDAPEEDSESDDAAPEEAETTADENSDADNTESETEPGPIETDAPDAVKELAEDAIPSDTLPDGENDTPAAEDGEADAIEEDPQASETDDIPLDNLQKEVELEEDAD